MPQMSPITWWLIFILLMLFMNNMFNIFPHFSLLTQSSMKIKKKEKKMKW